MPNKKIYLVITELFPTQESFRGPYVYDQVKAIEKDGRYEVVVLRPTSWLSKEKDYEYGGVKVHRFTRYDLPSNMWPGSNIWLSLRAMDKCLKRLGIAYSDITVVHAHVSNNARFANHVKYQNKKCLTVLQHHGYDVLGLSLGRFSKKEWHRKRASWYGVRECNKIDLHVGVSKEILQYLDRNEGIKLNSKYVLYNGVNTDKFFKKSSNLLGENKTFTIGCVANFWKLKDQITLIKAVEILVESDYTDIKVSFVGTGYTREDCEQSIQEKGLEQYFEFNNEVDHTQLNAYYNTLDLFVLPSYWDSFGCVYVEAYACGVPFMTAKGTGITELIPKADFEKWVIEPHDYIALARNIKHYMDKHEKQTLNSTIDIDTLVHNYLDFINIDKNTVTE